MASKMYTIVVAGGSSTRFGSDKLFEKIDIDTVLEKSVNTALEASDGVVVVIDPKKYKNENVLAIVPGGKTRSESVKNGLAQIPNDADIIAVHDGARPLASLALYEKGRKLIEDGNVGAIPGINVTDTIKTLDDEQEFISASHDRSKMRAAQTPQIFDAQTLRDIYAKNDIETDDSTLFVKAGFKVKVFDGELSNIKITNKHDLDTAKSLLNKGASKFVIGTGYDIHPFSNDKSRKLVLGGVSIDHVGLEGHSDSDAIAHALTDALLSAIAAPDLGTLFPANKDENKNEDSFVFLEKSIKMVKEKNYFLGNVSIIVNAQVPKLSPYLDAMKEKIAIALKPIIKDEIQISITPKHGEGIGDIGNGEAIAVYCTVLLNTF